MAFEVIKKKLCVKKMSSRRSMTRDIHESIRLLLGKNVKVLLKVPVKLELKGGDKTENRVLVFTAHRLFVVTAKVPARIDHHFHYLDFRKVESRRPNQIVLSFSTGHEKSLTLSFRPSLEGADPAQCQAVVDEMIATLAAAVRRIFPGVPVEHILGPVEALPPERVRHFVEWKPPDTKEVGPCGGFSSQYLAMCDFYALPFREEVAWDVDTIYFSHDSHELCLQDFEHLDHRDLICIVSALEHNTWFTKLRASGNSSKLSADICDRILGVVGKSISLQELHLSSIGARWEFAVKLAQSMAQNPHCSLSLLDLSCNFLEDKGVNQLSAVMAKMPKGMHHLNLSHCSLTSKGTNNLSQALVTNRLNASTLTYLNLCGNSMKEETHALCAFLAQPNRVAILDISNTDTPLDVLFAALVRGCTSELTHLNMARNPFSASKKAKEIPAAFKQFFATTLSLQYLNLSYCKLPPEALKHLLLGLACNEATANVELNLSNNSLGSNGAQVLESCLGGVKCLSRLDLSENNIEGEMTGVMHGLTRNKSLVSVNVSRNMTGVKPKHLPGVTESIVALLQDEDTSVQKLNLADCRLKNELNNVINALGSNQCLQHLDISGNHVGDVGARLLAKALQINTRLRTIVLDRNGISLQGYTDITYALQSNYALRHIPFPTFDLQPCIKTHPDRADAILHRMQDLLQRNASPHRFRNTAQAFRLTQGFLLSSTQQILDRVSASTQDGIDALKKVNPEAETATASELIREADNSKHLLSALHEASSRGEEVDNKLAQVSLDLSTYVEGHVKENLDAMLACAESQCPQVLQIGNLRSGLETACQAKCQISSDFIRSLIADQVGLEIHNKVNEINLIIANHISDRVIDQVIECMTSASKTLATEVGSSKKKRSLTPDVLKGRGDGSYDQSSSPLLATPMGGGGQMENLSVSDATSQKSEPSPMTTPQTSKRKSMQGRRLRPKSVVDNELSPSRSTPPDLLTTSTPINGEGVEEDTVPDLPATAVLQHLGKARPKRAKKYAPSRGAVVRGGSNDSTSSLTPDTSIDDGVDRFYNNNNSSSAMSTPTASPLREDNVSKEDLSSSSSPSTTLDRKSPGIMKLSDSKHKITSGLSCLSSSAVDEDTEEKPLQSPSVQSISDIFAKSASSKVAAKSAEVKSALSPFASRKTSEDGGTPVAAARRSFSEENEHVTSPSAADDSGKKTPDELVRRHGVGHGNNLDLMAQIKEKRASMHHTKGNEEELSPPQPKEQSKPTTAASTASTSSSGLFGNVKLRSTGLVGSLTSPSHEAVLSPVSTTKERSSSGDDIDNKKDDSAKGGSILGLRAAKFKASPEVKPRLTATTSSSPPTTTTASSTTGTSSTSSNEPLMGPKPKPLPKPRPWSIVGVDRKSGEVTSVSGAASSSSESKESASAASKASVRDLINNMNKETTTGQPEAAKRKGSSLPRGTQPPGDKSSAASSSSPSVAKKNTSTSDDPRILKLEDDYAYEGVMDV